VHFGSGFRAKRRIFFEFEWVYWLFLVFRPAKSSQKRERRLVCTVSRILCGYCSVRSHLGRFRIVVDLMCVCAGEYVTGDHLIWHCERFRLERHRLIDALAALNVSIGIGIPIRDLCTLKKWCAVGIWRAESVFTRTLNGFGQWSIEVLLLR
jgi:hypothetical protein